MDRSNLEKVIEGAVFLRYVWLKRGERFEAVRKNGFIQEHVVHEEINSYQERHLSEMEEDCSWE